MNRKSWIVIVLEAIMFIILLGAISRCSSDKIDLLEHNISAYKSQIERVELENSNLLIAKESLILSESQAREELEMTKEETRELKKKLGSAVAQISKLQSQVEMVDTVYMKGDTVYVDKNYNATKLFSWNDQWTSLKAKVRGSSIQDSQLSIYDLKMNIPITFGVTDDYKVFATSPNPYVTFEDITSATIYGSSVAPKRKRFHHGIFLGFGVNYGLITKSLDIGPSLGYGFTYSF
jgi:NOL1/NOP2/fmu family ribosome biogenesis protein